MADITSNLVGHWPLQDNAASTTIVAAVGNNGTLSGGDNTSAKSVAGPGGLIPLALQFNGTDDAITAVIDLSGTNVVTVAGWAWWNTFANDDRMLWEYTANSGAAASGGFVADPNSGAPASGFFQAMLRGNVNFNNVSVTRPTAAAWHHIAIVYDMSLATGEVSAVYFDGISQAKTQITNGNNTSNFANSTFYMMSRAATSLFGAGKLADVRIYSRSLAADDVSALAQMIAPFSPAVHGAGGAGFDFGFGFGL